ncbi:molybdopterin-dependent oxidoreductase [Micromonospora echinofusca]|uniref:molybdopterin-dependent oxidoreductase n=1 Tax=Micromonospora echinofusca TaxID=47858 RepID=UPI001FCB8C89|nr:molybdopterin-dependent oxidoreductase [Micromonospora echinofusca]
MTRHDTNAELCWAAMAGQGYVVPTDRFFVRNHTRTPLLDVDTWRPRLFGSGLRGQPGRDEPVEFGYDDLRALPAREDTALIECAGNARRHFTDQQGQSVRACLLPWHAVLPAGVEVLLRGRSWSGDGAIRTVEVDTGAGRPTLSGYNTFGYLFDGVVRHPVRVTAPTSA